LKLPEFDFHTASEIEFSLIERGNRMGMWLAGLSTLTLWAIVVLPATAVSLGGLYLFRRAIPYTAVQPYNDILGFAHGIIGVVYAVLLGFTIIVSWEQFEAADRNVGEEASAIADLYNDNKLLVATFQQENRTPVKDLPPSGQALNTMHWALSEYVTAVVESEWDAMSKGTEDLRARNSYAFIWAAYSTYSQSAMLTPLQATFFGESLRKLNELGAHRRARLLDARKSMPTRFWTLLVGGGILIVAFSFLYGVADFRIHMLIVATMAGLIGVCLALIISLEHPFRGDTGIRKEPFVDLQATDPWSPR
jgi:hypothetical protein